MHHLLHDLRESARALWRNKASSLLTIGIRIDGIAFTTVVGALLKGMLLPLRPPAATELVYIYGVGNHELREFKAATAGVLHGVATHAPIDVAVDAGSAGGDEEWATGEVVSSNYFELLQMGSAVGRMFSEAEDRDGPAGVTNVIVSTSLWKRLFASSPDVLGATLRLDGQAYTVAGVAPADFGGMREPWSPSQFWVVKSPRKDSSQLPTAFLIARAAPGLETARVKEGLAVVWRNASGSRPRPLEVFAVNDVVAPFSPDPSGSGAMKAAGAAATLAGIVLLIAVTNVTGLLGIRGLRRAPEFALKQCLGVGPERIKRQLLGESVILFLTAAFLGLAAAQALMRAYASFAPVGYGGVAEIDWSVAVGVIAACCLAALIPPHFAFRPTFGASYRAVLGDGASGLIGETKGRRRFTNVVLVAQVGMAILLLIVAGGNVQALGQLGFAPPGYDANNVVKALVGPADIANILALPESQRFRETQDYYARVLNSVRTIPEVEAAALASFPPSSERVAMRSFVAVDGRGGPVSASQGAVSSEYFATLGISVVQGRAFDDTDVIDADRPVVVSVSLARAMWGEGNYIGRRLKMAPTGGAGSTSALSMRVVGVVSDVRRPLETETIPALYTWTGTMSIAPTLTLLVRTKGPSQPVAREIKALLRSDSATVLTETRLLVEEEGLRHQTRRAIAFALVTAGVAGVFMAGIGILAAMSFSLTRRQKELGIRLALGAQRHQVVTLIVRESFLILAVAAVPGVALGVMGLRVTASLGGTPPALASIVAGTMVPVALMMMLAVVFPAIRAVRRLPIQSIRVS